MHGTRMSNRNLSVDGWSRRAFVFIMVLANVSLFGCDYLTSKGKNLINEGTVRAVDDCIVSNSSQLIDERITRALCISENEQPYRMDKNCYNRSVDFRKRKQVPAEFECYASFEEDYGSLRLVGSADNDSADLVLTRYSVEIISDNAQLAVDSREYGDLWIQPSEFKEFRFFFDLHGRTQADVDSLNSSDWRVRLSDLQVVRIKVD